LNLFVYGTLQPGGRFHDDFCARETFIALRAWTAGRLYDFPHRGYPAAAEDPDGRIHGHVLCFSAAAPTLLTRLDDLEGYDPRRPAANNLYYRTEVEVFTLDASGRTMPAWCYFMPLERILRSGGVYLESGCWRAD